MKKEDIRSVVDKIVRKYDGTEISLLVLLGGSVDDESILIAFDDCRNWISIPYESIQRLEPLGPVRCGNHEHTLVKLTLMLAQIEPDTLRLLLFAQNRFFTRLLRSRPVASDDNFGSQEPGLKYALSCTDGCAKYDHTIYCYYRCWDDEL